MPSGPAPRCEVAHGVQNRLIGIARAGLPNETCGLLHGPALADWTASRVVVDGARAVRNSLASPTRFALDGAEMLATETAIEEELESVVVGVFHSHPTSEAIPSATDLADAKRWDPRGTFLHIVVSMQGFVPAIRAWRFPPDAASAPLELALVERDDTHTNPDEAVRYPRD